MRLRPGLCLGPPPARGELTDPIAGFQGPLRSGKEAQGEDGIREGEGNGGEGSEGAWRGRGKGEVGLCFP